jgi:hypothetical protein
MNNKLLQTAYILSIITITYNIAEGLISVFYGVSDDVLTLLGFGVDSFVEFISGLGILHMVSRMKKTKIESWDSFERQALKITGTAFYILTVGLIVGSVINFIQQHKPDSTIAGIIISSVSIVSMYFLMKIKLRTGKKLNSKAIIADANCTRTCFILSIILLASSLGYAIFHVGYIDNIGSLGIAYYAFQEGREAFEKAEKNEISCSCNNGHKEN